ncbi:MAG: hypothetical protein IV094_18445 [Vitreoscilla sp.]|nr:hypothetical protein [Vitreoscilla sp.]
MKLIPLTQVAAQIKAGAPLPWSVRDAHGGLLLARGNLIGGEAMRDTLVERGAFVDADEVRAGQRENSLPVGERRITLWSSLLTRLSLALQDPAARGLETNLRGMATELATLVQADPDMSQAMLVHPELCAAYPYSVAHSAHVAATWALVALRHEGSAPQALTVPVAAALSMNIAMLSLQDRLTHLEGPLKAAHRAQIQQHPRQGAALLRAAGVTDPLWLAMVEQHHEDAGDSGDPGALPQPLPEARRLRMMDVYCACFGARAHRPPLLADNAVRRLFQQYPKDPTALVLAKEFGLYPPGTVVRLASLELALVVRRGPAANAPVAVALQNASGEPRATPARRDTSLPAHKVIAAVSPSLLRVRIPWAQLFTTF